MRCSISPPTSSAPRRTNRDPAEFDNRYEATLAGLVKVKIEGNSLTKRREVKVSKPDDLLAALRESAGVLAHRRNRCEWSFPAASAIPGQTQSLNRELTSMSQLGKLLVLPYIAGLPMLIAWTSWARLGGLRVADGYGQSRVAPVPVGDL